MAPFLFVLAMQSVLAGAAPSSIRDVDGAARKARSSQRVGIYLDAAAADDLSGRDRLRALDRAIKRMKRKDGRRLKARVLEAQINAALGRNVSRRTALKNGKRDAQRLKDRSAERHLGLLLDQDRAVLGALSDASRARSEGKALSRSSVDVAREVEHFAAAATAMGDEVGVLRADLLLALVGDVDHAADVVSAATGDDVDDAVLKRVGRFVRTKRRAKTEARHLVADALRLEAAVLARRGQLTAAVSSAMAADVEDSIAALPGTSAATDAPWGRRRETAALCARLRREQPPAHCGTIERKAGTERRFYNFALEGDPRRGAFDAPREDDALQEYVILLEDCVQAGAKANLTTNSTVEIEWALRNDGTVGSYDLRPMRLRETSVDACFKDAFTIYRHPRYAGEMQHMRLSFEVGE